MKTKTILLLLLTASLTLNTVLLTEKTCSGAHHTTQTGSTEIHQQDWDTFTLALAWVESRWNDSAESPRQAAGYLQITPILVKDANRITGTETFSLQGRFDRDESIRLFNVIQTEYNPEHDLHLALKIWNPYSKVGYHRAVMRKYEELMQQRS